MGCLLTGVSGVLQAGALTDLSGRDDADVRWVLNGSDGSGGQDELVPHLSDVEDANALKKDKTKISGPILTRGMQVPEPSGQ